VLAGTGLKAADWLILGESVGLGASLVLSLAKYFNVSIQLVNTIF